MTPFVLQFREACRTGDAQHVLDHLDDDAVDLRHQVDDVGVTPLMLAAFNGHVDIVNWLLHDSNALQADHQGKTALIWAVEGGHPGVVTALIAASDLHHQDMEGKTALMWAEHRDPANGGSGWTKEDLLLQTFSGMNGPADRSWKMNFLSRTSFDDFMLACRKGNLDEVRRQWDDQFLTQAETMGPTPLIVAVTKGNQDLFNLLLPKSDRQQPDGDGCTPLMWSIYHGNENVMKALLPTGDVHRQDHNQRDAMKWATDAGHVEMLVKHLDASHLSATDAHGKTLLAQAQEDDNAELVFLLTEREAVVLRKSMTSTTSIARTPPRTRL